MVDKMRVGILYIYNPSSRKNKKNDFFFKFYKHNILNNQSLIHKTKIYFIFSLLTDTYTPYLNNLYIYIQIYNIIFNNIDKSIIHFKINYKLIYIYNIRIRQTHLTLIKYLYIKNGEKLSTT